MYSSKKILQVGLLLIFSLSLLACQENTCKRRFYDKWYEEGYQSGYNKGYKDGHDRGYKDGHDKGYKEGYSKGKVDGHKEGYQKGTKFLVVDRALPSLGGGILIALALFGLFSAIHLIYRYLKNPVQRRIQEYTDTKEAERLQKIAQLELERLASSTEHFKKIKTDMFVNQVFNQKQDELFTKLTLTQIADLKMELLLKLQEAEFEHLLGKDELVNNLTELLSEIIQNQDFSNKEKSELYKSIIETVAQFTEGMEDE